jgi:CrcB protein
VSYFYVVAGAVAGAPLRYFLGSRVQEAVGANFPAGTMFVNVTGCFFIGLLATLAEERDLLSREARLLLITGLLGSYTTFSAFGYETLELLRDNLVLRAMLNVVASCALGVAAAWFGMIAARASG